MINFLGAARVILYVTAREVSLYKRMPGLPSLLDLASAQPPTNHVYALPCLCKGALERSCDDRRTPIRSHFLGWPTFA